MPLLRPGKTATLFLYLLIAAVLTGCRTTPDDPLRPELNNSSPVAPPSPGSAAVDSPFGNSSGASPDPSNRDNYLLTDEASTLSYNASKGTLNWVVWKTTRADLGDRLERPDFRSDTRLPAGFRRIEYYDYSGSGYDRGHIVPSADRFGSRQMNEKTFVMTNIVPQTDDLNQYPWNEFESYVRSQVRSGSDAYQIAGVYGDQGRLKGKITVPSNCWKIVLFVRSGRAPAVDTRSRIVAVDMPNKKGIANVSWQRYRTSVRAIEQQTGLDLFAALPKDVQDNIETRIETVSR